MHSRVSTQAANYLQWAMLFGLLTTVNAMTGDDTADTVAATATLAVGAAVAVAAAATAVPRLRPKVERLACFLLGRQERRRGRGQHCERRRGRLGRSRTRLAAFASAGSVRSGAGPSRGGVERVVERVDTEGARGVELEHRG